MNQSQAPIATATRTLKTLSVATRLLLWLVLATSLVMSRAADHDWRAYLMTAVATVIFVKTETNPLIVVAAAAVLGYLGFV